MQEQLPLRPAEFVKIRDGFIAFLKQPAGTPIEQVMPQEVLDAMASAARRGRKRRVMLDAVRGVAIIVAVAAAALGVFMNPLIVGATILLAGGAAFMWAHNRSKFAPNWKSTSWSKSRTDPSDAICKRWMTLRM